MEELKYLILAVDRLTEPLKKIEKSLVGFQRKAEEVSKKVNLSFGSLSKSINNVGKSLSLKMTAPLVLLGAKAISTAGQFERYERVLTVMLGSVDLAKQRFSELVDIAAKTPFDVANVINLGNQLQALGSYSKENIMMLGDLAAAAGKPIEQVTRAYAKLKSGQKGLGLEMFRDLLITTEDWTEATGKGFLSTGESLATYTELINAIPIIMRKKNFLGMMHEQSKGIEGIISNLKDNINKAFGEIGKSIFYAVDAGSKIKGLTKSIENLTTKFINLSPETKEFITWTAIIATIAGPALIVIGQIGMGITAIGKAMIFLRTASLFLTTNPFGLALIAIGGIIFLMDKYDIKFSDIMNKLNISLAKLGENLLNVFTEVIDLLTSVFSNFSDKIDRIFTKTINFVVNTIEKIKNFSGKSLFDEKNTISFEESADIEKNISSKNTSNVEGKIDVNFSNMPKSTAIEKFMNTGDIGLGINVSYAGI